ncbi:hypothetical protein NUW54_g12399 [Trametes sanguinea]|uniref:Uncharacterized protein n=1 Tax=Trametes sanguinea TaxID=158606 RepID=A0ACC1MYD8_9APHY|nr:hypothetical protein NUW54_g12399 [Trametes sanguinea]
MTSKSTLSSVVSNLVRAQMGSSVKETVQDDDLDRHVAELILKEAKQKAQRYQQDGIRAYLARSCNGQQCPEDEQALPLHHHPEYRRPQQEHPSRPSTRCPRGTYGERRARASGTQSTR